MSENGTEHFKILIDKPTTTPSRSGPVTEDWQKKQREKIDSVLKRVNELRFSRAPAI